MSAGERVYPLPRDLDDARFSAGLLHDVAKVLAEHGYPPVRGTDWVDLRQAVYRFLYVGGEPR